MARANNGASVDGELVTIRRVQRRTSAASKGEPIPPEWGSNESHAYEGFPPRRTFLPEEFRAQYAQFRCADVSEARPLRLRRPECVCTHLKAESERELKSSREQ